MYHYYLIHHCVDLQGTQPHETLGESAITVTRKTVIYKMFISEYVLLKIKLIRFGLTTFYAGMCYIETGAIFREILSAILSNFSWTKGNQI